MTFSPEIEERKEHLELGGWGGGQEESRQEHDPEKGCKHYFFFWGVSLSPFGKEDFLKESIVGEL